MQAVTLVVLSPLELGEHDLKVPSIDFADHLRFECAVRVSLHMAKPVIPQSKSDINTRNIFSRERLNSAAIEKML
jgi:hypothetical protein